MIHKDSSTSSNEVYSANGQLLKNIVFLSQEEIGHSISPSYTFSANRDLLEQCSAFQSAEGNCSVIAGSFHSLETKAVEKSQVISVQPHTVVASASPADAYMVLGVVTVGSVALTAIAIAVTALVLGRDVSLAAVMGPSHSVKLNTKKDNKDL